LYSIAGEERIDIDSLFPGTKEKKMTFDNYFWEKALSAALTLLNH
jgi:hypothetical protein